jgi:hypothetical protein
MPAPRWLANVGKVLAPPPDPKRPQRRVIWNRAIPIFALMMALLFAAQYELAPRFPNNPIFGQGSIGLSLIAGLIGAVAIAKFATETPVRSTTGPNLSKTQRRRQERAQRPPVAKAEEPKAVASGGGTRPVRRKTRRRR